MQSSSVTAPTTVLCIACGWANVSLFQQWLGDKSRYRLIFWESRDSFDLDSTHPPSLILLDSSAGIKSLPAVTAQWPTAKVIVLLKSTQENDAPIWLSQGADDYLINAQFTAVRLTWTVQRLTTLAESIDRQVAARTAELCKAKESAEALNRIGRRFLTNLSHELRTPINAILEFSQKLSREANLSDQQRDGLSNIFSHGEHLLAMVDGMLGRAKEGTATKPQRARRVVALAPGQPICRILIVEDDWTSRVLLQTLLLPLGFEIQVVTNGQDAIHVWADWQPHLIWIDAHMAAMDGYETTHRLRTIEQNQLLPETPADLFVPTKIIALTDNAEKEYLTARAVGCDDAVSKPLKPHVILEKIAEHLAIKYDYATNAGQAV
ncbi:response regulator [Nodosilinea nodulosa]|uniref:response regulator n=1 Tax=Nodosilinea nodulosa TaxID=416001 RepID=UPI00031CBED0|nr:response regulator [Nodosilinea nodulosa]